MTEFGASREEGFARLLTALFQNGVTFSGRAASGCFMQAMDNNLQRTLEVFVDAGFTGDVDSRNAVFQWMQTTNELGTKTSAQRLLVLRHLANYGFRFPPLAPEQQVSLFEQ